MNILFFLGVYPGGGGVERVTTCLANDFVRQGHICSLVSFEERDGDFSETLDKSVKLFKLRYPTFSLENIRQLRKIVKEQNIDIIINQWAIPFYVAILLKLACKGNGTRIISVHHNRPDTNQTLTTLSSIMENGSRSLTTSAKYHIIKLISQVSLRITYELSDYFVVLSKAYIKTLKEFIRVKDKRNKIRHIYNPLTIQAPQQPTCKENIVLYVGRIEYTPKKTFRVVDIWRKIEPEHPNWKLCILGDGPDAEGLQQRIAESGTQNIQFMGFKNPIEWYQRSKMLLLVSDYDGFGLVIVEAMSYDVVPIVFNSYPTAAEIIDNGINGVLTPTPYNIDDMVNSLSKLMSDDNLLSQMSQQAKEKSKIFSRSAIVNEWKKIILE